MMAMPEKKNEQKIMLWRGAKRIVGSLFLSRFGEGRERQSKKKSQTQEKFARRFCREKNRNPCRQSEMKKTLLLLFMVEAARGAAVLDSGGGSFRADGHAVDPLHRFSSRTVPYYQYILLYSVFSCFCINNRKQFSCPCFFHADTSKRASLIQLAGHHSSQSNARSGFPRTVSFISDWSTPKN